METKTKILIAAATCVILAVCLVLFFVLRPENTDETNTGTDETNTVQKTALSKKPMSNLM